EFSCQSFRIRTYRKVGGGAHSCHSGIRHTLLVTTHYAQVLSFQTIPHSFALFCTYQKPNPFVFMQFRTLCEKHRGCVPPLHCSLETASPRMPLSRVILQPRPSPHCPGKRATGFCQTGCKG